MTAEASELELQIEKWSSALSERLIEIRFIDIDDMKVAMKAHLKSAMLDCLHIQMTETERKLIDAKKRYVEYGGGKNNHIQKEIIALKAKRQEQTNLMTHFDNEAKIVELIGWMRTHHEESLIEFYKHFDTVRPDMMAKKKRQES